MENKQKIIYIHGANSSPLSFNYISFNLPNFDPIYIQYDTHWKVEDTVSEIIEANLEKETEKVVLVGHSLGGIIAALISQKIPEKVDKLVTLSTPFLGSKSADYLKWIIPHYLLFRQISTKNKLLAELKSKGAVVPTLNIATHGVQSPLFGNKASDGVITLFTQMGFPRAKNVQFKLNHFEVLLSNDVLEEIQSFLDKPQ